MNSSEKLWKVAETVYLFMSGQYNAAGSPGDLPIVDCPYTNLIPDDMTGEGGGVHKEFDELYDAKNRIIDELIRLENTDQDEYREMESLLNMLECLMETASIEAFIGGYNASDKISGKQTSSFSYEELLKKQFTFPQGTEIYSYNNLCGCFDAMQERLYLIGGERKTNPDLYLMKLSCDVMLRYLTDKAYSYGLAAGVGTLPMWYEE